MAASTVKTLESSNPTSSSDGTREYTIVYEVTTTDKNDGPITARDATGIPSVNDSYTFGNDYDNGAYATSYSVQLKHSAADHKRSWLVTVTFSSRAARRNDAAKNDDPLDDDPIISGGFVTDRESVTKTSTGGDVVNSAGDFFEGLEKDLSRPTLTIQKNYGTLDLTNLTLYQDAVNDATFFTLAAHKWKLTNVRWQQQFRGDSSPYYAITFEFHGNGGDWKSKPVDRGFRYLTTGGERLNFVDESSPPQPTNEPGNLDGSGAILGSTSALVYYDGQGGNPSPYKIYTERDFSTLGIPITFPGII